MQMNSFVTYHGIRFYVTFHAEKSLSNEGTRIEYDIERIDEVCPELDSEIGPDIKHYLSDDVMNEIMEGIEFD